jgi:hypothetical protein
MTKLNRSRIDLLKILDAMRNSNISAEFLWWFLHPDSYQLSQLHASMQHAAAFDGRGKTSLQLL